MKCKEARPTPVRILPYFFEQLPRKHDASTTALSSSSWSLAPVTRASEVDAVLWSHYAPATYRSLVDTFMTTEHRVSQQLAEELREAWVAVEATMKRNQERKELLETTSIADDKVLAEVGEMLFWTAEDIATRFGLTATLQKTEGTQAAVAPLGKSEFSIEAAEAAITLDFSVRFSEEQKQQQTHQRSPAESGKDVEEDEVGSSTSVQDNGAPIEKEDGEAADGTALVPGMHRATAWRLADRDLLNPCKRPHCLRRFFAPFLQRRPQLEKTMTLFLNELQQVQSLQLPALEKSIANGVMFNIGLYIPFKVIALCIARYLCVERKEREESSGVARGHIGRGGGVSQPDLYEPADSCRRQITTLCAEPVAALLPDSALSTRRDTAEAMWGHLFAELDLRRATHAEAMRAFHDVAARDATDETRIANALDDCANASAHAMELLKRDAELCTRAMEDAGARTRNVLAEMDNTFAADEAKLLDSIRGHEHAVERSASQQERLARQLREAVKALHVEQVKYEEHAQELLQERLALSQLRASYAQVHAALLTQREEAAQAQIRAQEVKQLLVAAEAARESLITSCRQHVGRLSVDAKYRRCRLAQNCARNVGLWQRCVDDVTFLYEERLTDVNRRITGEESDAPAGSSVADMTPSASPTTWRMEYLAAGERDWAVRNLLDVRGELAPLDVAWAEVTAVYAELDEDAPSLLELSQPTPPSVGSAGTCGGLPLRSVMRALDKERAVQRHVTTLSAHRAIAARAVAGRAAAAAASLAEINMATAEAVVARTKTCAAEALEETNVSAQEDFVGADTEVVWAKLVDSERFAARTGRNTI